MSFHKFPCLVDESDLVIFEARQGSQILILALIREGVRTLVAIVEMGEHDLSTWSPCQRSRLSLMHDAVSTEMIFLDFVLSGIFAL